MNLKFWDTRSRLIAALARLTDDEAREIIKAAKKGFTLTKIGEKGKRKQKEEVKDSANGSV